jgi:hypothetical protein
MYSVKVKTESLGKRAQVTGKEPATRAVVGRPFCMLSGIQA